MSDILKIQAMKRAKRKSLIRALANRRGQIWTTYAEGLMMLAIAGILFSVLNQIYSHDLAPLVIRYGVNVDNANFIQTAWSGVLIAVVIAFIIGLIEISRRRPEQYGYI